MALALASSWRGVIAAAVLLALNACETSLTEQTPPASAPPVVDRSPRVADELTRGKQALADGDLQTAQGAFTAALRGSPNDPEPAIGLAETYLALGDLETAGRLFELVSSRETGAKDARLLQGRGLVALRQGRTEEAIELLEQSVDNDSTQWRAWAGLGRAYGRQGKSRQARTVYERAEKAAPSPAAVINDIGMSHLEDDNPAAALEEFQRALAIDPANRTASANARIARAMLREYDAAVSGARPEELPDVLNNVGYIAVTNGDFDVADSFLRRAIEMSPVYHEAASANLDLLAQAKRGVPVLALAGEAVPASDTAEDVAATGVTGSPAARAESPSAPPAVAETAMGNSFSVGAARSMESTDTDLVNAFLAKAPDAGPATEARPDGFKWEPPTPEVKEAVARARAARRAAQRRAAVERARRGDPEDPRAAAWPVVMPTGAAARPVAPAEPMGDESQPAGERSDAQPSPAGDPPSPATLSSPANAREASPPAAPLQTEDGETGALLGPRAGTSDTATSRAETPSDPGRYTGQDAEPWSSKGLQAGTAASDPDATAVE